MNLPTESLALESEETARNVTSGGVGSTALLGSVIDCAAFLRRPERKKAGTLIVMRPGVTSQQVVDTALEIGMAIRYAKKEEMNGRGGVMFLVLPNALLSEPMATTDKPESPANTAE